MTARLLAALHRLAVTRCPAATLARRRRAVRCLRFARRPALSEKFMLDERTDQEET
jgi:hypothetical protein